MYVCTVCICMYVLCEVAKGRANHLSLQLAQSLPHRFDFIIAACRDDKTLFGYLCLCMYVCVYECAYVCMYEGICTTFSAAEQTR